MSGYIGNIPVPQATQSREVFTATSGQTTFATVGYPVGFVDCFLNGVKLINGTDFTATNGSDVVLTVGAATGDTVEVISNSTFEVNSQTFTGTTTINSLVMSGAATGTNLTLSGGVYLGGTGAANLLDDYETGSWTPQVTDGTYISDWSTAYYVKVGDIVTIYMRLTNIGNVANYASFNTGAIVTVGNLPFSCIATYNGQSMRWRDASSAFSCSFTVEHTTTSFQVASASTGGWMYYSNTTTGSDLMATITYITA